MNVKRELENAVVTRLAALTYITTNSIPVKRWDDRSTARGNYAVIVRCQLQEQLPASNYYHWRLAVMVVGKASEDQDSDKLQAIYAPVSTELLITMTPAALTTTINNAKIIINGFVSAPCESEDGDSFNAEAIIREVFLQYNP